MTSLTNMAVKSGVRKFFEESRYCDVYDFKKLCEMAEIVPPKDLLNAIQLHHRVHWVDMDPDLRKEIFARTMAMFAEPDRFPTEIIDAVLNGDPARAIEAAAEKDGSATNKMITSIAYAVYERTKEAMEEDKKRGWFGRIREKLLGGSTS